MIVAPGRATRRAVAIASALLLLLGLVQLALIADPDAARSQEEPETELAEATQPAEAPEASDEDDPSTEEPVAEPVTDEDLDAIDVDARPILVPGVSDGGRLGTPEGIGDVNGDGIDDLAVGAFSDSTAGEGVGAVHVLLMAADGTVADATRITRGEAGFGGSLLDGGGFGFRIAALGDVDGDRVPDIVVSAYRSSRVHDDAGEVWVLFLNPDGSVKDWQVITEGFGGLEANLREGDQFGVDVSAIGDLDRDGVTEIAVGMWRRDGVATDDGGVLAVFLNADGTAKDYQEISAVAGWADAPIGGDSGFGVSVEGLGDLNGDGVPEIGVGAISVNDGRGEVWILSLDANARVVDAARIAPGVGAIADVHQDARFGSGLAALGDLDGDRSQELAVGGFGLKDSRGVVWIVELGRDFTATDVRRVRAPGLRPGDLFGHTVAVVGDVDGDGALDLAVGAPGSDADGPDRGALYLLDLSDTTPAPADPAEDGDDAPATPDDSVDEVTPGEDAGDDGTTDDGGDSADDDGADEQGDDQSGDSAGDDGTTDDGGDQAGDQAGDDGTTDDGGDQAGDDGADDQAGDDGTTDDGGDQAGDDGADAQGQEPEVEDPDAGPDGDPDGDGIPNRIEGSGDIDADGIPNNEDPDTDGDGIADAVEGLADADGDGIADFVEIDDDGDGVLTIDEGAADSDGDGLPDHRDPDADNDGLPDGQEGSGDSDRDGVPDRLDEDSDNDGLADGEEGTGDSDGDGVSDNLDEDSDDDGLPDGQEGSGDSDRDGVPDRLDEDSDNDGLADGEEGTGDSDGDGVPDNLDEDSDDDGLPDGQEGTGDADADGVPDNVDEDSDNDGVPDGEEGTGDADRDGLADNVDADSDNDGLPDGEEGAGDSDNDGLPDLVDADSDNDGLPDGEEGTDDVDEDGLPNNVDDDADGDGVPDAEEGAGDSDGDGVPDFLDARQAVFSVALVTAPDIRAGERTQLQLEIVNEGPDPSTATTAELQLPDGVIVESENTPAGCELSGRTLTCEIGELDVDETAIRTIDAEVLGAVQTLDLSATVTAPEGEERVRTGPLAVLDQAIPTGLRSTKGAVAIVLLTLLVCGGILLSITRDQQVHVPKH